MANEKIDISQLADAVMDIMEDAKEVTAEELKKGVKKAGKNVATRLHSTAPKKSGRYAASWRSKVTEETSEGIQVTVYSPNRYMLTHLLENGHAKRGGGRVEGIPHIGPAGEAAMETLEADLARSMNHGL